MKKILLIFLFSGLFAADLKIIAVGDIMFHSPQISSAKNGKDYDFAPQFEQIKPFLQSGDVSIGNFETTVNEKRSFSGYPLFNTPKQALKALKDAGIDALATANNHALDTKISGVLETIKSIKEAGIVPFGTGEGEKFAFIDKNGINLALLAYSYGYNGLENSLNKKEKSLLNFLDETHIKDDLQKVKSLGADFIIIYAHWGNEYQNKANDFQKNLAKKMVDWGANVVIGNHPHVVQETMLYQKNENKDENSTQNFQNNFIKTDGNFTKSSGFIAFSCGNFISNQRLETMKNIHTEQGVAFEILISKDENATKITDIKFHPLWVNPVFQNDKKVIKTYLANDFNASAFDKNIKFIAKNPNLRAKKAYETVKNNLEFKNLN